MGSRQHSTSVNMVLCYVLFTFSYFKVQLTWNNCGNHYKDVGHLVW